MGTKLIIQPHRGAASTRAASYETDLCQSIVEAVLSMAAGRKVTGIRVRVGHPADPDLIRLCMQEAAAGTVAEHAAVEFIIDPPVVRCLGSGNEAAAGYALALLACRRCGSFDIDVTGSDELTLESITFTA